MSDPERILLVRFSHLGDVVCTLGLVHALHRAYPRAEIAWAIQEEFAELVQGLPGVARVIRFDRGGGLAAWRRLRVELRDFGADLALDAQGNMKSAAAMWCSGARRRVGMARADWREPLGALVLHGSAPPTPADRRHAVDRMATLIEHVAPLEGTPPRHDVGLRAEELAVGEALLVPHLDVEGCPTVLLHLSSAEDVRGWSEEHWSSLIRALRSRDRPVLVLSGPGEEPLGERLRELHPDPGVTHIVGQRGLRELASLLTAAAARSLVLVSCDSGPMHLAWSSGVRVVLLAGPQSAERTGPWPARGDRHRTVRAPLELDCAPCLERSCSHPEGPLCMSRISIEDVCDAVEELEARG